MLTQAQKVSALVKDGRIQRGDDLMEPVYSRPVTALGHIRVFRRHPLTGAVEVDRRAVYMYNGKRYVEARLPSIVEALGKMTAVRQRQVEVLMQPGAEESVIDSIKKVKAAGPPVVLKATRVVRLKE